MVGIVSGLSNALSGIASNARFFRSTANNLANSETTGFRAEKPRFETQPTSGARFNGLVDGSTAAFLRATGAPGDLSAGGNGFLPTRDPASPNDLTLLKSAGFSADANGVLTDAAGRQLLGFPTDANGRVTSATQTPSDLVPVQLPTGPTSSATSRIDFAANLPANASVGDAFQTSATVVDSLGREQLLNATFTKTGANTFDAAFALDPAAGVVTTPAGPVALGFDGAGRLATVGGAGTPGAPATLALGLDFSASGGAAGSVDVAFGEFGAGGVTQLAAPFSVTGVNADGATPSALTGFAVDGQGVVRATTQNGSSRALFKIPTASVPAASELASGRGGFTETTRSGGVTLASSGAGGFTGIDAGLSRSDVEVAREITNLSIGSNAYRAAIKVAQTGDELLDSIIDIKR
jgi:flagellar hook protein FlgE